MGRFLLTGVLAAVLAGATAAPSAAQTTAQSAARAAGQAPAQTAGQSAGQSGGRAAADPSAAPGAYRIRLGDRISISVLEDPGLNQSVLVRPDGRISLPLAGTVVAGGRTPEELQAVIRNLLAPEFVTPPNVTVSVVGLGEGGAEARIYAIGEIGRPGQFEVRLPITILQALTLAGGPSTFAATDRIQVRRQVGDTQVVYLFNYDLVLDGAPQINNFALADGDVIVVPERGLFD